MVSQIQCEAELISNLKTKYPYIQFKRYTIDPLDKGQYKPFGSLVEHYSPGSKVQYNGQLYYARNGVSGVNAPGTHDAWDSVAVSTFPEYTSEHQNYVKGRIVTANGQLYLATQYTKKDPTKTPSWAKWGGWPWMPLGENSCN